MNTLTRSSSLVTITHWPSQRGGGCYEAWITSLGMTQGNLVSHASFEEALYVAQSYIRKMM